MKMPLPVLDLFILSILSSKAATPYDLHRGSGISLGASLPALRRLTAAGLVERSSGKNASKRPRHEYRVKAAGRAALKTGWQRYLTQTKSSLGLDEVLRIVTIGLHHGGDKAAIRSLLEREASGRLLLARQANLTLSTLPNKAARLTYTAMKLRCDSERWQAEAHSLSEFASLIPVPDDPYLGKTLLDDVAGASE